MGRVQRAVMRCLRDGVALTTRELTVEEFHRWTPAGASAIRRALATLKAQRLVSCTARRWRLRGTKAKPRKAKKLSRHVSRQGRDEDPPTRDLWDEKTWRDGSLNQPWGGLRKTAED